MNAVTETPAVSTATLEHVLGTGDLSKLTTQQRVEYYARTCQTLGLNPLTRPFRFLALNGQIQLYATKDCTDQLRKIHSIGLHIVDKAVDGDLFIVTVRAKAKDGREDEDMAAVTLGQLRGESKANALMKGITKAKRRVTLSICGLGMIDESELDTVPGAMVFDADETPPTPIRQVAQAAINPVTQQAAANNGKSWAQWAESLALALHDSRSTEDIARVLAQAEVQQIYERSGEGQPSPAKSRILALVHAAQKRLADLKPPADPDEAEAQAAIASWDPPPAAA